LHNGDLIKLGQTIQLRCVAAAAQPDGVGATVIEAAHTKLEQVMGAGMTVAGGQAAMPELSEPPYLVVTEAGQPAQKISLSGAQLTIGRSANNAIVLKSPIVSGHHARLEKDGPGYKLVVMPETTNPLYVNGQPLSGERRLQDGDLLRIGSQDPGLIASLAYHAPAEAAVKRYTRQVAFGEKNQIQIGRDQSNDIVLDSPLISRYHAVIERVGTRYRAKDLQSTNGTFVNDTRIEGDTWLNLGDTVRVGPFRFVVGQEAVVAYDESRTLRVEVRGLNKWVRKDLNLLKDISVLFQPREFIVIVGQSGGGKSTFVDAVAGYRPATDGQVLVNGIDIYKNFNAVRSQVGFVPQKDIIHTELTVFQALDYAAKLRMPPDTTREERHQRVMEVLQDLDLVHRKDVQISGLSGGQQKRVSIGVELLTRPGLFFLDEPTSGLDPGTETALMHLMRRLADQGRTIILITHATKNVMLADKVVFLARGGYLAWFGPPEEALQFFNQYRSERDQRSHAMEFDEIYAILDDPSKGKAEEWANRYKATSAYQRYVVEPLGLTAAPAAPKTVPATTRPQPKAKKATTRVSGLRQFKILSSRNLKILTRDRTSLILMLLVPLLMASLDVVMAMVLGRDVFGYQDGDMTSALTSFFMTLMYAYLVGAVSQMREFVKEQEIFRRERLVNLKVMPYVISKVWVAFLLAIYQAFAFTAIHHLAYKMPGGALEVGLYYLTMFLSVLAGMMIGLFASALAPNANSAPLLVILLIVPQLVLAGAMISLPTTISAVSATRWSYESLVAISGAGSDVAADACWQLTEEQRDELTLDDKWALGCRCMGVMALNQDSCDFPGLGSYYDPALDAPEPVKPVEPASIGEPPPEPVFPEAPQAPADQTDQAAMGQFLLDLQAHQQAVEEIRADYETKLDAYKAKADQFELDLEQFQSDMEDYLEAQATWEVDRNTVVGKAEGLIKAIYDEYDWAFVNKEDESAYWSKLGTAWGMLALYSFVLFVGISILIYRKS
jgi:ABC-type multidrug transport system ATPase subunit